MSEQSIQKIHDAIQEHLDETKETGEQLTDFVVARAAALPDGGWSVGYIASGDITPHGTSGLLDYAKDIVREDLLGKSE